MKNKFAALVGFLGFFVGPALAIPTQTPQWGWDPSVSLPSGQPLQYKIGSTWFPLAANVLQYTPPFTNSVPLTIATKLAQNVSIDDFGAVGNGTTDDATALTRAIAALPSPQGGVVNLSCGKNYYIASNINVPNNVEIKHCFTPGEYGLAGTGTPNGAFLTQAHVNLASTATFTMNGNSGYYGAVFRAGQTYPSNTIAGYAGTAFTSAAGAIQDVHINALVVGFAACYNGTNRVDRLQLTLECDANPTASSGAIILGPSADTARIKARAWPWGTYSASGGPTTRTGYGLQVLSGLQDDTHIDFLDYGHSYGVVTAGNGNIHWEHVWTDNNTNYGFLANAGDRSDITAMWIYNSKGARFNANGTWGIGYYLCDTGTVASAECIETAAAASPLINIGTLQITKATLYGINMGSTTAQVNIASSDFKNVNGGIGPYIVGPVNWTTDQIQFGTTPNTDLAAGSSLLGGNPINPVSIASASTLALPVNADNFNVTGTTSITSITGTYGGRTIVLNFRGALTLTNGVTIGLANGANFVTATGYSIALQYDQTSATWRELWRSPSSAEALSNGTTGTAGTPIVLQDRPTITNSLTIQGAASPAFIQYNTAAAANEKYWDSIVTGAGAGTGALSFRMLQDGYVSAVPWLTVTRSGTSPTLAAFRGPISTGTAGSVLGTLALSGNTSGTITVAPQAAAGTYNFNLPTTAGTATYLLTSQGGGASAMDWTSPTITVNSTSCTLGSSCTVALAPFPVTVSGTVTSGGIPYFNSTTQMSSSALLAANALMIGGGAGVAPSTTTTGTGVLTALGLGINTNGGVVVPSTALAQYSLVVGGGSGTGPSVISTGSAGQLLSSGGAAANPSWTTATFPSTATSTGTILRADGTNWAATTATYPTTAATGTILAAGSTNVISATATPTIGTSLTVPLISGGTTASSTLTLQSTSGAGTSDSIIFNTGSQLAAMTLDTGGRTILGTTARNTTLMNGRGNLQVTNNFLTTGTAPDNWILNTNAFTDEKTWDYFASAGAGTSGTGSLQFRALNDTVAAANGWMYVTRTGYVINNIALASTTLFQVGTTITSTTPAFRVNTTASGTGIGITPATAGSGIAVAAISSGTNENMTLDAKGSGTITLNGTATGAINLNAATNLNGVTNVYNKTQLNAPYAWTFYAAGATAGYQLWDMFQANSGTASVTIRAVNDAYSAATNVMTFSRVTDYTQPYVTMNVTQLSGGGAPTIACTGGTTTGASVTAGSTSNTGQFTTAGPSNTACTITFSAKYVYPTRSFCSVAPAGSSAAAITTWWVTTTASTFVINHASSLGTNTVWNYQCGGN